jgi:TonB-dependent SusC/RagA subfamily outer membrane receptor
MGPVLVSTLSPWCGEGNPAEEERMREIRPWRVALAAGVMLVSGGCASDALLPRPAEAPRAASLVEAPAVQPPGNGPTSIRMRCGGSQLTDRTLLIVDGKVLPHLEVHTLDPEWIESIEIIKGPSAIALYGRRAADGVILVKTRRR